VPDRTGPFSTTPIFFGAQIRLAACIGEWYNSRLNYSIL
jgi:hypothetical protein